MKHLKNINESLDSKDLFILSGDDWKGLYYEDKLIYEGHSIDWLSVLKKFGYKIEIQYLEDEEDWTKLGYSCPSELSELKLRLDVDKYNL